MNLSELKYNEAGLIPCIVQDAESGEVLMMAWMSEESIALTLERGETVFWSRSRQEIWHKGATSGNTQKLVDLRYDCDADTLLALVHPAGPACHTGERTCFFRSLRGWEVSRGSRVGGGSARPWGVGFPGFAPKASSSEALLKLKIGKGAF